MNTITYRRSLRLRDEFPVGIASVRAVAAASGMSERTVYRRCLDGGPWRRILPGVVQLFTGRPTNDQLAHAALVLCGPDAMVTGIEACRRHGIRRGPVRRDDSGSRYPEIHVLVPEHKQVRSVEFVHVERTMRPPASVIRAAFRSHRWCAPARMPYAGSDHPPRSRSCCPMLCNKACARSARCARKSRPGRGGAQPFRAPFWPTLQTACDPQRKERRSSCGRVPGCPSRGGTPPSGARKVNSWATETAGSTRSRCSGRSNRPSGT